MNLRILGKVTITASLLGVGGCADNEALLKKETAEQTVAASSQGSPRKEQKNITNSIAAVVNDDIITLYDVTKESRRMIAQAEEKTSLGESERREIRRTALDRLIEKKLTEQKIKELNIQVSEEEIRQAIDDVRKQNNIPSEDALIAALAGQGLSFDQYRKQLREQIEKLKLVSMEVRSKVHVSETEMLEYYNANLLKYTDQESYRARHIFFKTGEKATSADVLRSKVTAIAVLADAKEGKDFAELAKKFSEDPAARKDGGDLGSFKKGDMQPELEKAILALQPGEVSELVTTPIGFHIIKLEARTPGETKPFESVKAEIEEIIYRNKSEERFSQWAKDLRSKASVEIKNSDTIF
ncbi:MAG: peptidylprolyl isomerase [Desulfuromonadaceae bacterium]|nr:peptidylprolyl isomerase [Desulfuromonadaceae bacterium]MDD2854396.1 peptidylprolyl isomerase [Desulfuromonadaceae bacterium]